MIKTIILLVITYILNIIDYFQTIYAVHFFGLGVELNPIARYLIEHNCGWLVKIVLFAIILIVLGFIIKIERKQVWIVYVLNIFYVFLISHNFIVLSKLGLLGEEIMTTISIIGAIITAVSAIAIGVLCTYYKHLKKQ